MPAMKRYDDVTRPQFTDLQTRTSEATGLSDAAGRPLPGGAPTRRAPQCQG